MAIHHTRTCWLLAACFMLSGAANGQTSTPTSGAKKSRSRQSVAKARKFAEKYRTYTKLRKRYEDPAFDRYVNLTQLGKAWNNLDSALLTDVAMQLAYAEDVLQRQHKKIDADTAMDLALKLALEKKDDVALARLADAAGHYGKTELSARIKTSTDLSLASRSAEPALSISVSEVSSRAYGLYRSAVNVLTKIKISEDQEQLAKLESSSSLEKLPEQLRDQLAQQIGSLREAITDDAPFVPQDETPAETQSDAEDQEPADEPEVDAAGDEIADILRTLSAASRAYDDAARLRRSK